MSRGGQRPCAQTLTPRSIRFAGSSKTRRVTHPRVGEGTRSTRPDPLAGRARRCTLRRLRVVLERVAGVSGSERSVGSDLSTPF